METQTIIWNDIPDSQKAKVMELARICLQQQKAEAKIRNDAIKVFNKYGMMDITETERLMLVEKKEEISVLTLEIFALENDPTNALEIKEKLTSILSLLNTIGSYSDSENFKSVELGNVEVALFRIFNPSLEVLEETTYLMAWREIFVPEVELFCNYVNSMTFDFTDKKCLKITFPNKFQFR